MSYDLFSRVTPGTYADRMINPRWVIVQENGVWRLYEHTYPEDPSTYGVRHDPIKTEAIYAADTLRECKAHAKAIRNREINEYRRQEEEKRQASIAEARAKREAEADERMNTQPSHRNTNVAIKTSLDRKAALQMLQALATFVASEKPEIELMVNTFRSSENEVEISLDGIFNSWDRPIAESWIEPIAKEA